VLADHTVPAAPGEPTVDVADDTGDGDGAAPWARPPATLAACVHTDGYGTRSATLVRVPAVTDGEPQMLVADGPPCVTSFVDVTASWHR
jgi:hypothetical protein